jgi:hypothetical protein
MQETQISTKEFLKRVFDFFKNLGNNWQLLLIALLVGTCFDLLKNNVIDKSKTYFGEMTFHLELEGGAGGGGQLGGLAANFGFGGGMQAGGADLFNAKNFEAIMLSGNVFQNAFMKEVTVKGKKMLFINYYIDSSDIKTNEWAATLFRAASPYANYKFTKKPIEEFTPYENQIFADVYTKLFTATTIEPLEKSSLIKIHAGTTNEILTKVWIENLIASTETFYKTMKTKKTKQLLVVQERRLDSLSYMIKNTDRKMARVTFENPNVVDPGGILKQQQVTRDNTYMTNQYYTQMANVETLNRLIIEQTPIFTVLEPVRLPLAIIEKKGINTRLGGIICFFAAILVISLRQTYRDIFSDNQ